MARFSDAQIILILQKAARRINRELGLTGTDNAIVIDPATGEFTTPDNEDLEDLVLMQAECMIASKDFINDLESGGAGLLVKDGEQTLDSRESATMRGTFFDSAFSPCALLKETLKVEKMNWKGGEGKMVY